jgi:hypothetical protein
MQYNAIVAAGKEKMLVFAFLLTTQGALSNSRKYREI